MFALRISDIVRQVAGKHGYHGVLSYFRSYEYKKYGFKSCGIMKSTDRKKNHFQFMNKRIIQIMNDEIKFLNIKITNSYPNLCYKLQIR